MILQNKIAVVYGAGGSLGGAVSKAFAAAGAKLYLSGRNLSSVLKIAGEIDSSGDTVATDQVDATNPTLIRQYLEKIINKEGRIDISFNAIGISNRQNVPLTELSVEEYVNPVSQTLHTQFLTATAVVPLMAKQKSGVILTLTATPGGIGYPYTGGFAPACAALENFSQNLASEVGIYGIRVVNIRSGGSPDSKVFADAIKNYPEEMKLGLAKMQEDTMLKKLPLMAEIANAAVFLCSDLAGNITGVTVDLTGGTTAALNYRVPSNSK